MAKKGPETTPANTSQPQADFTGWILALTAEQMSDDLIARTNAGYLRDFEKLLQITSDVKNVYETIFNITTDLPS